MASAVDEEAWWGVGFATHEGQEQQEQEEEVPRSPRSWYHRGVFRIARSVETRERATTAAGTGATPGIVKREPGTAAGGKAVHVRSSAAGSDVGDVEDGDGEGQRALTIKLMFFLCSNYSFCYVSSIVFRRHQLTL